MLTRIRTKSLDMEKDKPQLTDQILSQIQEKKVKMKPKWQFVSLDIGFNSLLAGLLLVTIFSLSLLIHFGRRYQESDFADFGQEGLARVGYGFPIMLIVTIGALFTLSLLLVKRFEWGYKRSIPVWAGLAVIVIALGSSAMVVWGINEKLEKNDHVRNFPIVRHVYEDGFERKFEEKIVPVEITYVNDGSVEIITLDQKRNYYTQTIQISTVKIHPPEYQPQAGDRVVLIGEWEDDQFEAWALKARPVNAAGPPPEVMQQLRLGR